MKHKISLIVPSQSDNFYINEFLINICLWTLIPSEIIIINTSNTKYQINKVVKEILKKKKIKLFILNKKNLYPGAARNAGILKSKSDFIVFLDMNTLPYKKNWLKSNFNYILNNNLAGVLGQTKYLASTHKEKIIRASTYGINSLLTVPGSIFKRQVIEKNGLFNSTIRAGEDTEWILRLNKNDFNIKKSLNPIYYKGLYNVNYLIIVKKWFRNYSVSGKLPHLSAQKNFYFFLLFIFFFFIVFNWNIFNYNRISSSVLWVPHITKIFLFSTFLSYLIIRGILVPIKKKVSLKFLLPFNFLLITINSFVLDATKLLAFLSLTILNFLRLK